MTMQAADFRPLIPAAGSRRRAAPRRPAATATFRDRPLGQILVSTGALTTANLDRALDLQRREAGLLGEILVSHRMITENALALGLALQRGVRHLHVDPDRADPALIDILGADACLRQGLLPWRRAGLFTVIATSRPEQFARIEPMLRAAYGDVRMVLADEEAIRRTILSLRSGWLVARAEARTPEALSVRRWSARAIGVSTVALLTATAVLTILYPARAVVVFTLVAVLCLAAMTLLRVGAAISVLRAPTRKGPVADVPLPSISVLVPLLSEAAITDHLLGRLGAIDYPRDLLEILLVVEETDAATRGALTGRALPAHVSVVSVPAGNVRTKPRAMNYALDFCQGEIVGIYDAEDAPDPDQLRRIAARFAEVSADTVCLQGTLAFYNASQNWLARCFAIDYASWFRVVLPGLVRMGLVIPLGGTTLFFRRHALETLGRWDAHNVTEDADLGIRIARFGWRSDIVETTTREEANCRVRPWIRQRARWLKGYALTWAVHMANPVRLLRELGVKRFVGVQVLFLGTVLLFLLAPVLWSFWLIPLGLPHPFAAVMPRWALLTLAVFFAVAEGVNMATAALGVARNGDRWLIKWVPAMTLYFPLAALAGWRAMIDMTARPFFWDKTSHGHFVPAEAAPAAPDLRDAAPIALPRAA